MMPIHSARLNEAPRKPWRFALAALAVAVLSTSAFALQARAQPLAADDPVQLGFVAFGDSGLHEDFVDPGTPITTEEEYIEKYRRIWARDHRNPEEFAASPSHFLESYGSFIMASGMHPVANAMKRHCADASCEFALMLGDNIYPDGAETDGNDERRFAAMFTEPFAPLGAGKPDYRIYAALGNHDWHTSREGAMAQVRFLESNPPFYMNGHVYRVEPPAGKGQVELFVIDTNVLLAGQEVKVAALNPDGSEVQTNRTWGAAAWVKPATAMEKGMVEWLEKQLADSDARWKFVMGHHPIWSGGGFKFQQARALRQVLLPTLCRHADAYLAGHDHTLELHEDNCQAATGQENIEPLLQIVSGAASKQRGLHTAFLAHQSASHPANRVLFARGMVWGFAYMHLDGDSARVDLFSTPNSGSGEPKHEFRHMFERRSGASVRRPARRIAE